MQGVMVDTSAWVAYFRGGKAAAPVADAVDYLLSGDEALLDEVVLTELVPFFRVRGETAAEEALSAVRNPPLQIDWPALRDLTRGGKEALAAAGLTIPFPQRDVHVVREPAP